MEIHALTPAMLVSAALAACSSVETRPALVSNGMLAGRNGMTLYVFDKDVADSDKSVCNGPCATNWPPQFASDSASGDYSIIVRDDGKKQWALKGKPLYYWAKDQNPGDKSGEGFNNVWHVAKP